jgi:hypothetical protein
VLLKGVGRDSKQQGRKWDGGKEGNAGEEEGVNNLDLSGCLEGLRSLIQRSQGTVASDRFIQAVADFPALILLDFLPLPVFTSHPSCELHSLLQALKPPLEPFPAPVDGPTLPPQLPPSLLFKPSPSHPSTL